MHISEYRFYSMLFDLDVVRVSVWNAHGDEYWAIVLDGVGYAQRRAVALDGLAEAIDEARPAGEILPFGCLMDQLHFNTQHVRQRRSAT